MEKRSLWTCLTWTCGDPNTLSPSTDQVRKAISFLTRLGGCDGHSRRNVAVLMMVEAAPESTANSRGRPSIRCVTKRLGSIASAGTKFSQCQLGAGSSSETVSVASLLKMCVPRGHLVLRTFFKHAFLMCPCMLQSQQSTVTNRQLAAAWGPGCHATASSFGPGVLFFACFSTPCLLRSCCFEVLLLEHGTLCANRHVVCFPECQLRFCEEAILQVFIANPADKAAAQHDIQWLHQRNCYLF